MVFDRFKKMFNKAPSETPKKEESESSPLSVEKKEMDAPKEISSIREETLTENIPNEPMPELGSVSDIPQEIHIQTNQNSPESIPEQQVEEKNDDFPKKLRTVFYEPGLPPQKMGDSNSQIQDAMIANNQAIMDRKNKNWTKTLEGYNQAIELYPQYAIAYYNRAIFYQYQEKLDKALEDYNKAIELNPRDPEFYNNRGNILFTQENYTKSLEDYTQAITLFPNYSDAYHNRAQLYAKTDQIDLAIKDCMRAIELNPDLLVDYYNLACLYAKKCNPESAFSYLEQALKKGYKDFTHIRRDPDWENLRNNTTYEDILDTWEMKH